ncbi:outer membrane protein transport protein, partial [PVC group bacterium]|nr:outer membrane protein transport protein [PVC group bacterium]
PNVELVLDYVWINWSGVDELGDHFGWDDQHIGRIGVTWDVSDELTLRTGYSHGNAPIDEDTAFSNSLFPAIMEDHLACGFSYDLGNLGINFAYVHAFEQEVTANGNDMIPATGQPAGRGTEISMYQNTYTLGATYAF